MKTNQPIWKCAGRTGDIDPIAFGGGFVYTDETGVYGPELTFFEPGQDEEWNKKGGMTPVTVYRVMLDSGPREWWYPQLENLAKYTGQTLTELETCAKSKDPQTLAILYSDLISYFGAHEFDSYPNTFTEDECYAKYANEMKMTHTREVSI